MSHGKYSLETLSVQCSSNPTKGILRKSIVYKQSSQLNSIAMLSAQSHNDVKYIFTQVQKLLDTAEHYSGFLQGPFVRTFIVGILTKDFEKCTLQDSCNIHFTTKENLSNFLTRNASVVRKIPSEKEDIDLLGNEYMKYMLIDDFDDRILTLKFTWGEDNTHWDIINHQTIYMFKKIHSANISSSLLYSDVRNNIIRLTKGAFDILVGQQVGSNYPVRFANKYVGKVRVFYKDVEYVCVRKIDKTIIREGEKFNEFTLIKLSEYEENSEIKLKIAQIIDKEKEKRTAEGYRYINPITGYAEKVFDHFTEIEIPDSGVNFAKDVVAEGQKIDKTDFLEKAKVYVMGRLMSEGYNLAANIYVSDILYIQAYNDRHNPENPSYDSILETVKLREKKLSDEDSLKRAKVYVMNRLIVDGYNPKGFMLVSDISDEAYTQAYNDRNNESNSSYDAILDFAKITKTKILEDALEYIKRTIPKKYISKDISTIPNDLIIQAYNERHTSNVAMNQILKKLEEHYDWYLLHHYG